MKMCLLNYIVTAIYTSETRKMSARIAGRLNVTQQQRLQRTLRVSYRDRITTKYMFINPTDGVESFVLNRVLKPVCFRGVRADSYTIHEWEATVLLYLCKIGTLIEKQADEVYTRSCEGRFAQ